MHARVHKIGLRGRGPTYTVKKGAGSPKFFTTSREFADALRQWQMVVIKDLVQEVIDPDELGARCV